MILSIENRNYKDDELICTVELQHTDHPEELMDWMVSMLEVWEEDLDVKSNYQTSNLL